MNKIAKQDRNGVRTPVDIERRYNFNKLEEITDTDERLTNLENNKVDKVAGKNLSSNDFTNGYKMQIDENTESRHSHSNKEILDTYTKTGTELEKLIEDAVASVHSHSNKSLLDSYTQTNASITKAVENQHTHNNKDLLDSYTQTNANLADAVTKKHTHSNKNILDTITQEMLDQIGTSESEILSYSSSDYEGHIWFKDGYLEQWGRVTITPTSANAVTNVTVYFPYSYSVAPDIDAVPQVAYPNAVTWSVGAGASLSTAMRSMVIYMTRTNTSATQFRWRVKGFRNP